MELWHRRVINQEGVWQSQDYMEFTRKTIQRFFQSNPCTKNGRIFDLNGYRTVE